MVVSSRKQENVDRAVQGLKDDDITVAGIVCNVSESEHRTDLLQKVGMQIAG